MTTIALMSDLHLEFDWTVGGDPAVRKTVKELCAPADILVLAGDIFTFHSCCETAIDAFSDHFKGEIIYVAGNHDMIGINPPAFHAEMQLLKQTYPRFHPLECETIEIKGQRFHGATGWYPKTPQARHLQSSWFDFSHIPSAAQYVYDANINWGLHLGANLRKGDIVISHMLPGKCAITERWADADSNCFFDSDMEHFMEPVIEDVPALWLFGHTHDSQDKMVHNTRIICNPRGYWTSSLRHLNKDFKPGLLISL